MPAHPTVGWIIAALLFRYTEVQAKNILANYSLRQPWVRFCTRFVLRAAAAAAVDLRHLGSFFVKAAAEAEVKSVDGKMAAAAAATMIHSSCSIYAETFRVN